MITFDAVAYEKFSGSNPALHELLITHGVVTEPPTLAKVIAGTKANQKTKRVKTPLKTLTAIQATLNLQADDDQTIDVSLKLYAKDDFDFKRPDEQFTIPATCDNNVFVGTKNGYTIVLDSLEQLVLEDGVDTMILPPIIQDFHHSSHAVKTPFWIGQSRAVLKGSRGSWPTGQAKFI